MFFSLANCSLEYNLFMYWQSTCISDIIIQCSWDLHIYLLGKFNFSAQTEKYVVCLKLSVKIYWIIWCCVDIGLCNDCNSCSRKLMLQAMAWHLILPPKLCNVSLLTFLTFHVIWISNSYNHLSIYDALDMKLRPRRIIIQTFFFLSDIPLQFACSIFLETGRPNASGYFNPMFQFWWANMYLINGFIIYVFHSLNVCAISWVASST